MARITTTSALAGVAGATAIVVAGFGASQAFADSSTPTSSSSSSATPSTSGSGASPGKSAPSADDEHGPGAPGGHHGRGPGGPGVDAEALAEKLGLDESKVEAAIEKVRAATKPATPPTEGQKPTAAEREARQTAYATALAKELDVSEEKLTTALDEIRGDRETERRTELSERLDEAVSSGDLTAADKASVLKAFDAGALGGGPH
ncbi:hypothetical protein BCF74_1152 [Knoellia remsis]|uniref:ClpA/ClpB-like protein n=1 Tax=Knoellia remsis TaxID=407159 RepID=A0A2T0UHS1_9MICO|nr:hypothetical protein [Knoellia remsis]PRY57491.1 hypothetical protein BCF74_1152 [Knoellia remsis]